MVAVFAIRAVGCTACVLAIGQAAEARPGQEEGGGNEEEGGAKENKSTSTLTVGNYSKKTMFRIPFQCAHHFAMMCYKIIGLGCKPFTICLVPCKACSKTVKRHIKNLLIHFDIIVIRLTLQRRLKTFP